MTANILTRIACSLVAAAFVYAMPFVYSQDVTANGDKADQKQSSAVSAMEPEEYKEYLKHVHDQIIQPRNGRGYNNVLRMLWSMYEDGILKTEDFDAFFSETEELQVAAYRKELDALEDAMDIRDYLNFANNIFEKEFVYDGLNAVYEDFSKALLRRFDKEKNEMRNEYDYSRFNMYIKSLGQFVTDKDALDKTIEEARESMKKVAIAEFREMKDPPGGPQVSGVLNRLRAMGISEEELEKLKEEYNDSYCQQIFEVLSRIEFIPENRSRISGIYSMLERYGAKEEKLAEIKGKLKQLEWKEKKAHFVELLNALQFENACMILEKLPEEGMPEAMEDELRAVFYINFKVYFQRKVWQFIGQDIYKINNFEDFLLEAKTLNVDEELIDEWRQQIHSAVRMEYMRILDNCLLMDIKMDVINNIITRASSTGLEEESVAEMREKVAEAKLLEVRRMLEMKMCNKAQLLVDDLKKSNCPIPEDVTQVLDEQLRAKEIERLHWRCLQIYRGRKVTPEMEQQIHESALKYGVSEETLKQWREEAKKR